MLYHTIIKSNNDDIAEVSVFADNEASARDKVSRWFADEVAFGKQCNEMYKDVTTFEISSCCAINETREIYADDWIAWAHSEAIAHAYHATSDIKYWDEEYSCAMYIIDISRATLEELFTDRDYLYFYFQADKTLQKAYDLDEM